MESNNLNRIYENNENYYNELITIVHILKNNLNKSDEYVINILKDENIPIYIMQDLINKVGNMI
jgi:hypothetical protein